MSETIRDVVVRIRIQQEKSKIEVPGAEQARQQVEKLTETSVEGAKKRSKAEKEAGAAIQQARKAEEQRLKELDIALNQHTAATERGRQAKLQMGEALKLTSSGALNLARAYALNTAATEEDMQAAIRNVAAMESYIQTATGVIDMATGIAKGYQAIKIAADAATTANKALAASNALAAASGAAGAGRGIGGAAGGAAAAGGGAIASAAVAGGGGALLAGAKAFASAIAGFGVILAKFLVIPAAIALAFTEVIDRLSGGGGIGSMFAARSGAAAAEKQTDKMQRERDSRLAFVQEQNDRVGQESADAAQLRAAGQQTESALIDAQGNDPRAQLSAIDEARARAQGGLATAQKGVAAAGARAEQRKASGQPAIMGETTAAMEEQAAAAERVKDLEAKRLGALNQIRDNLNQQKDAAKSALETARQQLKTEEDRNKTAAQRFAQMGALEKAQLKQIDKKIAGGNELSESEVSFLEKQGFAQGKTEEFRQKQAEKEGFGNLSDATTGRDRKKETELRSQIEQNQQQLATIENEIGEVTTQIGEQQQALVKAIKELGDAMVASVKAAQAQAQQTRDQMRNSQQASRSH
jgi:hypothetical protein